MLFPLSEQSALVGEFMFEGEEKKKKGDVDVLRSSEEEQQRGRERSL